MRTMDYIKGQWEWIACQAGIIVLVNLILLTSTPLAKTLGEIFYLDLLVIFVIGLGYGFHYRRMKKVYAKIRQVMVEGQDTSWLFKQLSDSGENSVPGVNLMQELLEYQSKNFSRKEEDYRQRMNDLKDYLTQSVHDLKVNLSVCEMAVRRLENETNREKEENTDITDKLLFQIEQMKFRINQALFITRANHYSEDIVSEHVDLEQVVKEAISANAEFFINKGISIQNNIRPYRLVSDKKWIHYILVQILHNSSKYTDKNGEIIISSREDERGYHLHLRDNGIGIPAEELSRVFHKGFTGSNGRSNTKSTGMGMYYAKKMADILGIGLKVQSVQGEYTEFILSFYKLSDYMQRQHTSDPVLSPLDN